MTRDQNRHCNTAIGRMEAVGYQAYSSACFSSISTSSFQTFRCQIDRSSITASAKTVSSYHSAWANWAGASGMVCSARTPPSVKQRLLLASVSTSPLSHKQTPLFHLLMHFPTLNYIPQVSKRLSRYLWAIRPRGQGGSHNVKLPSHTTPHRSPTRLLALRT